jgi:pheromone a factor receptor
MAYMYPSFPIIGTISMLLCLYPVPAHWKLGNIATVSLALWTSIGLLICVINTCVWHGNMRSPYPIWGDIVSAYIAGLSPAIASSALCMQYRLWRIVRVKSVFITKREVRIYL